MKSYRIVAYVFLFLLVCVLFSLGVSYSRSERFIDIPKELYSKMDVIPYRNIYDTDCKQLYTTDTLHATPFDYYKVERDSEGVYYLNGVPLTSMPRTVKNCRRIHEFIRNSEKEASAEHDPDSDPRTVELTPPPTNPVKTIQGLADLCVHNYGMAPSVENVPYTYYTSTEGKAFLNNVPLDEMKMNRENCRVVQYADSQLKRG